MTLNPLDSSRENMQQLTQLTPQDSQSVALEPLLPLSLLLSIAWSKRNSNLETKTKSKTCNHPADRKPKTEEEIAPVIFFPLSCNNAVQQTLRAP